MNEIMTMRTNLANEFADAGAKLLDFTMTAGALAAIPGTSPQQYAVAGTLDSIQKVLPKNEPSHPQRRMRHGERPTERLSFEDDDVAGRIERAASPATASGDELTDDEILSLDCLRLTSEGDEYAVASSSVIEFGRAIEREVRAAVSAGTKPTADLSSFDADHFKQLLLDVSNESYFCGINLDNDEAYAGHLALAEAADKAIIDYVQSLLATKPAAAPTVPEGFVWPKPPERKGQSNVLFDDGYEEGWAKCIDTIRKALAATPAAPADAVKEAREQALRHAAMLCDAKYQARINSGHPREASTARALAEEIRALSAGQRTGEGAGNGA